MPDTDPIVTIGDLAAQGDLLCRMADAVSDETDYNAWRAQRGAWIAQGSTQMRVAGLGGHTDVLRRAGANSDGELAWQDALSDEVGRVRGALATLLTLEDDDS
jgi:hypothetical protein